MFLLIRRHLFVASSGVVLPAFFNTVVGRKGEEKGDRFCRQCCRPCHWVTADPTVWYREQRGGRRRTTASEMLEFGSFLLPSLHPTKVLKMLHTDGGEMPRTFLKIRSQSSSLENKIIQNTGCIVPV